MHWRPLPVHAACQLPRESTLATRGQERTVSGTSAGREMCGHCAENGLRTARGSCPREARPGDVPIHMRSAEHGAPHRTGSGWTLGDQVDLDACPNQRTNDVCEGLLLARVTELWKPRSERYARYWPYSLIDLDTNGLLCCCSGRPLEEIEEFVRSRL